MKASTRSLLFGISLFAGFSCNVALAGTPPLFEATHPDQPGRLLIAGTVHFLPDPDADIPTAFDAAYERADRLAFELDLTGDVAALGQQLLPLATDEPDAVLSALADAAQLQEMQRLAVSHGLPLQQLAQFEPWFIILQLNAILMQQLGLDADNGIDIHYSRLAVRDGKPVTGLETIQQQIAYFDDLPDADQLELLHQFLRDIDKVEKDLDALLAAWRDGNDEKLDELLQEGWQESTSLGEALVYRRNRDWIPRLQALADKPGTTLIMVGAGHLVGERSVPDLLRREGYAVERMVEE